MPAGLGDRGTPAWCCHFRGTIVEKETLVVDFSAHTSSMVLHSLESQLRPHLPSFVLGMHLLACCANAATGDRWKIVRIRGQAGTGRI